MNDLRNTLDPKNVSYYFHCLPQLALDFNKVSCSVCVCLCICVCSCVCVCLRVCLRLSVFVCCCFCRLLWRFWYQVASLELVSRESEWGECACCVCCVCVCVCIDPASSRIAWQLLLRCCCIFLGTDVTRFNFPFQCASASAALRILLSFSLCDATRLDLATTTTTTLPEIS